MRVEIMVIAKSDYRADALSFEQAAALPLAGGAAMVVAEWIDLQPSETILVVGATGGVGSYTVQLAKARGARVLATSTVADGPYIRGLGADELIDFENEDVVAVAKKLAPDGDDAVLDLLSNADPLARISKVVRPGGRVVSLIFNADIDVLAARDIRAANILSHPVAEHFEHLARLLTKAVSRCQPSSSCRSRTLWPPWSFRKAVKPAARSSCGLSARSLPRGVPRLAATVYRPASATLSNQSSTPPHTYHTGPTGRQPVGVGHSRFSR